MFGRKDCTFRDFQLNIRGSILFDSWIASGVIIARQNIVYETDLCILMLTDYKSIQDHKYTRLNMKFCLDNNNKHQN